MAKRTRSRSGRLRGIAACRGVTWRCPTKNDCYAAIGAGPARVRLLLRAECVPGGKCKAEITQSRYMLDRERGLRTMREAQEWACEESKRFPVRAEIVKEK